ncbi:MAG: Lrp/AsnC family transcriptional regulator [Burkholderiaceae bacterium]
MPLDAARRLALLNDWQHDFPLVRAPFARIAQSAGASEADVIAAYRDAAAAGALSRIGGVFDARAGGAGLLAAMAVPPERLAEVAAIVSAHPGVNHNYEREHAVNLWFVMTGPDAAAVEASIVDIERASGLPVKRLPMTRVFRIDLGFDLHGALGDAGDRPRRARPAPCPVAGADEPLAALAEVGLPLQPLPFDAWALATGHGVPEVLATLQRWLAAGTLRRFGTVVRHHELGFAANAMTVFDVPAEQVEPMALALARDGAPTLIYERARADGWPYNLYCMLHGRDRAVVTDTLAALMQRTGLHAMPHAVLFSRQRFKQRGARRFAAAAARRPDHAHA